MSGERLAGLRVAAALMLLIATGGSYLLNRAGEKIRDQIVHGFRIAVLTEGPNGFEKAKVIFVEPNSADGRIDMRLALDDIFSEPQGVNPPIQDKRAAVAAANDQIDAQCATHKGTVIGTMLRGDGSGSSGGDDWWGPATSADISAIDCNLAELAPARMKNPQDQY